MIADEVQTGMGRTGKLWGMDNWDVAPDIMTMGKALGGAVIPIGNFIATPEVFEAFFENPYIHSTTFGGNPMATSAAIGALHATLEEDIPGQAAEKGAYLKGKLEELAGVYPDLFEEVRGMGVIIGMQFTDADIGYAVSQGLFSRGVLIGGTLFNSLTLRMQPPAIITYEQMDTVLERLDATLADVRRLAEQGELVASLSGSLRTQRGPGCPRASRPSSSLAHGRAASASAGRLADHQSENPVLYQIFLVPFLARLSHFLVLGSRSMRALTSSALLDLGLLVGAERVDAVHVVLDAVEVRGRGVPEPPVVGETTGDVALVDHLRVLFTKGGHGEEILDVLEVLVVDLPDLQLLQQDVGERDAPGIELETAVVVDLVAVVELVEEDVDHGDLAAEVDLAGLCRSWPSSAGRTRTPATP